MAKSGPQTWNIDGKQIHVASTYVLALPEGLQYTIEYEVPAGMDLTAITDPQAYDLAFPIMKYAYENRLYERAKIITVGAGALSVSRIGVSLFVQVAGGTRGYRVARNLAEIQTRSSSR